VHERVVLWLLAGLIALLATRLLGTLLVGPLGVPGVLWSLLFPLLLLVVAAAVQRGLGRPSVRRALGLQFRRARGGKEGAHGW
jgi:hypothetical protein